MEGKNPREVTFDPTVFRQLDHGYAVTSHSSQALTADRVIANIDTHSSRSLINDRLANVAVSRAVYDARIYTNDAASLGERLATDISKTSAIDFSEVRQAVESLRPDGSTSAAALLRDGSRINVYSDPGHRVAAVALDYVRKGDRAVIFAPDPAEREELTRLIRADLHEQGRRGEDRPATVLTDKHLSEKQARDVANYSVGDVLRYGTNGAPALGIDPNSYATVVHIDLKNNILGVQPASGDSSVYYNPAEEDKQLRRQTTVFEADQKPFAEGERIQFTRSAWEAGIRVGNLATVEQFKNDGGMTVQIDSGARLELTPQQAQHIDHGYAIESTKRLAVDRAILSGDAGELVAQRDALGKLPARLQELSVYTSDGYSAAPELSHTPPVEIQPHVAAISVPGIPALSPELEGFAIEL